VLGKHGLVGERAIRAVDEYVTWHPAKEINQELPPARQNSPLNSDSESTAKGSRAERLIGECTVRGRSRALGNHPRQCG
jgi:hypothetical protein